MKLSIWGERRQDSYQENIEFEDIFTNANVKVRGRPVLFLTPSSLFHSHLPFMTLEFYLKNCQCQCEAGKEAIFVRVCITYRLLVDPFSGSLFFSAFVH